jgi:hypothetical protein
MGFQKKKSIIHESSYHKVESGKEWTQISLCPSDSLEVISALPAFPFPTIWQFTFRSTGIDSEVSQETAQPQEVGAPPCANSRYRWI